ncbi:hypothetical protein JAAARDRAFT_502027 [Jaapia argillacea MUCL 33604]|uniref:Uncharacterized protein n=1 Tax=Jaapia argillacea MUCL 33604 TaxID=933084 RepID=A0A067PMX4_9AGAM|nr:hypothetical protein JAAARDRAFT_502027 [Jaapia argillacea MUCL 33604]
MTKTPLMKILPTSPLPGCAATTDEMIVRCNGVFVGIIKLSCCTTLVLAMPSFPLLRRSYRRPSFSIRT